MCKFHPFCSGYNPLESSYAILVTKAFGIKVARKNHNAAVFFGDVDNFGKNPSLVAVNHSFVFYAHIVDGKQPQGGDTVGFSVQVVIVEALMDAVFRSNDQGRIYGVTFIDHQNKVALNGSRLGKDFSANVFNELFKESAHRNRDEQTKSIVSVHTRQNTNRINSEAPTQSSDSSVIEEAFGLSDMQPHGDDYMETEFARRMRKKKRKRLN